MRSAIEACLCTGSLLAYALPLRPHALHGCIGGGASVLHWWRQLWLAPASAPAWLATKRTQHYVFATLVTSAPVGTRSAPALKYERGPHQKHCLAASMTSAPAGTRLGTRVLCNKSWAAVRFPSSPGSLFILLIKRPDNQLAPDSWPRARVRRDVLEFYGGGEGDGVRYRTRSYHFITAEFAAHTCRSSAQRAYALVN